MPNAQFIEIVPFDASWPMKFTKEAKQLKKALGENCIEIHHIGSTAIPGVAAKPIIDILVVVLNIMKVGETASMIALGYEAKGEYGIPFRRYFRKGGNQRTHQVHVFEVGNPEIELYLRFRDWLINHPKDREAYARLKKNLAREHPNDMDSYSDGKSEFITNILRMNLEIRNLTVHTNIPKLDIKVIESSLEQKAVIAQLYELYTYEMTDLADFDINDNGYYGYEELPLYWIDDNKYPYLVWVDGKLAGFVLIQKGSPIEKDSDVWDVTEFFIMRKFRQKGVGQFVAHHLWKKFSGAWQVRVWDNNKVAHAFWDKVIQQFVKNKVIPREMVYKGHDGLLVYRFESADSNAEEPKNSRVSKAITLRSSEDAYQVHLDESNNEHVADIISQGLKSYNESKVGPYNRDPFLLFIRSQEGNIIAGLSGDILGEICNVNRFWVDESHRNKRLGTKIFTKLEQYARSKECDFIQLKTAEFQAKGFYDKQGYVTVAILEQAFMGHKKYIMRKVL